MSDEREAYLDGSPQFSGYCGRCDCRTGNSDGQGLSAEQSAATAIVTPPAGKRVLLSCKLGMIAKEAGGKKLSLVERLRLAGDAGFDGVDFDEAGDYTPQQAREAVSQSGVFVHNAINHAHWNQRLTSANDEERARGRVPISSIAFAFRTQPAAAVC